jgi:N6-L-threonylcarbamoyladenine synthase
MLVLGLESTCDETACALVQNGRQILSNIISSQIDLHAEYGGVVPELACRRHVDVMIPVIHEALTKANKTLNDIDLIAVAQGPGLIGALLIGLNSAKALSIALQKPFVGVNHIEAHLYAALMSHADKVTFPCLGVVLSGGHTTLVLMRDIGNYEHIGHTVDDAVGEAFDKVAKILGLPYPGGPQIEALALKGDRFRFAFKPGKVKGRPLDFSFSGLKTAVFYAVRDAELSASDKCDIAASFQNAALTDVVQKTLLAAQQYNCKTLVFGGGVTNNRHLRGMFLEAGANLQQLWPADGLSLDNAAMIAGLGYEVYKRQGHGHCLSTEAFTRSSFLV